MGQPNTVRSEVQLGASGGLHDFSSADFSEHLEFDLLNDELAADVLRSLHAAIDAGAAFDAPPDPLTIFRQAVRASIRQIEEDRKRFDLFVRFLLYGPYEKDGPIPADLESKHLNDDETARVIRYIFHRVINTFQGALAELLAVGPCVRLFEDLRRSGRLPADARIYVGDATLLKAGASERWAKGMDVAVLHATPSGLTRVAGVAEVKSYALTQKRLEGQIGRQLRRARRGILICDANGACDERTVETDSFDSCIRIGIVPAKWRLPRRFRLDGPDGEQGLFVERPVPPKSEDSFVQVGAASWRGTLRWSHEALASAAFEMTFWLMGKIGALAYVDNRPKEWADMSPEACGRNAAKMMLYYAILCSRTPKEERPAIALYNAYGFGYALGTSFKTQRGNEKCSGSRISGKSWPRM